VNSPPGFEVQAPFVRDEDLVPLSALQHLAFCERQCALIHVERVWEENRLTAEGKTMHERVDEGYREFRRGVRQFSGVRVRCLRLGIHGRLDVVEAVKTADEPNNAAVLGLSGCWELHPVEFKRGKPKQDDCDRVQLCAQALCLEEMTGSVLSLGSLFYGQIRRRDEVVFSPQLRETTVQLADRLLEIVRGGILPPARWGRRCRSCSLLETCQPRAGRGASADEYRKELLG
jgi:CRISPR-associated exonuclease Cas4